MCDRVRSRRPALTRDARLLVVALTGTLSTDVVDSGPATTLEQAMFARSAMSAPVASKSASRVALAIAISAKSHGLDDSRAAVSRASNCRWVKPRVDDAGLVEPGRDRKAP